MEATLRRALTAAIKARDPVAVSALRSALAALGNATAVDPAGVARITSGDGPIAGAATGLGAGEVERATLTPRQERAIVQAEVDEREQAAALGGPERAARLLAEAAVLRAQLA